VLVPLRRLEKQIPEGTAPRFIAEIIDMADQKSIVGMSGGPIFGYLDGSKYEVIAIQIAWDETHKDKVYGCPLYVVFKIIEAALADRAADSESQGADSSDSEASSEDR
jgi:hypothetical protein